MVNEAPISDRLSRPCTAFEGHRLLRSGPLLDVALAVKAATGHDPAHSILTFDDATGRVIDLDLRGTDTEVIERLLGPDPKSAGRFRALTNPEPENDATSELRGRGRPKLGVVSREVTLLPRHWEWLSAQPGGASAVLRRLVEEAKRKESPQRQRRDAHEAAYQFMHAIAGDFAGYEEAMRALFANDLTKLALCIADWPEDVCAYALRLATGAQDQSPTK